MITFPCWTKTESSAFFLSVCFCIDFHIATGIYKNGETNVHFRSKFSRSTENLRDVIEKIMDRSTVENQSFDAMHVLEVREKRASQPHRTSIGCMMFRSILNISFCCYLKVSISEMIFQGSVISQT